MFEKRKTSYQYEIVRHEHAYWSEYQNKVVERVWEYEDYFCWAVNAQKISTQNERSQVSLLEYDEEALEYKIRVRAKRNQRNIPTRWDDKKIAAWYYRNSWKHYSKRKRQWKLK